MNTKKKPQKPVKNQAKKKPNQKEKKRKYIERMYLNPQLKSEWLS